jgi:hypothetical protein
LDSDPCLPDGIPELIGHVERLASLGPDNVWLKDHWLQVQSMERSRVEFTVAGDPVSGGDHHCQ